MIIESAEIKRTGEKLMHQWANSDEEIDFDEFVEKYAPEEFKAYYKANRERRKRLRAQGIIEN